MSENHHSKGCLLIVGGLFVIIVMGTIFGFIFEGESFTKSFLDSDSEGPNIGLLRATFIILIIVGVIYLINLNKNKD